MTRAVIGHTCVPNNCPGCCTGWPEFVGVEACSDLAGAFVLCEAFYLYFAKNKAFSPVLGELKVSTQASIQRYA
jgi:hypothetical protein